MAARMPFAASVSLSVACCMRVYAGVLTNMRANMVSDSVGSMSSAMSEIPQQSSYNEVDQPNQEASNKHK